MRRHRTLPDVITATLRGDLDELRRLIDAGADVNAVDRDGRTALHQAAIAGDQDAGKLLLASGAAADRQDANGWTALHYAAQGHHVSFAECLLAAGASVDPEDVHGNTPLFRAVFESRGRGEMIRLLRQYGADVGHHNQHGTSPEELAMSIANFDVKRWFS